MRIKRTKNKRNNAKSKKLTMEESVRIASMYEKRWKIIKKKIADKIKKTIIINIKNNIKLSDFGELNKLKMELKTDMELPFIRL